MIWSELVGVEPDDQLAPKLHSPLPPIQELDDIIDIAEDNVLSEGHVPFVTNAA
jgi:hypothetical protein